MVWTELVLLVAIHRWDSAFVKKVFPQFATYYKPNIFVLYLDDNLALFSICQSELFFLTYQRVYLLSRYPVVNQNYFIGKMEAILNQFGIYNKFVEVDQLSCSKKWDTPTFGNADELRL